MGTRRDARASESLFTCTTAGGTWEFVVLAGGGCALLLDGERVTSGDGSPESIRRVVEAFLRVLRVRGTAGPRIPPPPENGRGDPEAGGPPGP